MADTKLISPGIPNYTLKRNLRLNNKYISNDGEDEGITISDEGLVTLSGDLVISPDMTISDNEIDVSSGSLSIDVDSTIAMNSASGAMTFRNKTAPGITYTLDAGSLNILSISSPAEANDICNIKVGANGATTIETVDDSGSAANLTLNVDGQLAADINAIFSIQSAGTSIVEIDNGYSGYTGIKLMSILDTDDYCTIKTTTSGATTITTVDADATVAHLTLDINGDVNIEADGHVEFDGCGVGFDLVEPTYDATTTIVDFRTGNKQLVTFDGGNITNLCMYFPATSGNFIVLVKQDGTGGRTITNYRTYDVDVGNVNGVRFPGAANPDLTDDANFVDIISVFWDADSFLAYGVATLNFDPS